MALMQLNGLGQTPPPYTAPAGTVNCTDPATGDLIICPPGTQCDPMGSGQCVGNVPTTAPTCPVGTNLTGQGQNCQCPSGYEYDANQNQCVPGYVGVYTTSPLAASAAADLAAVTTTTATTYSTSELLLMLALAGVAAYFMFKN